jgi:hypothetical protein
MEIRRIDIFSAAKVIGLLYTAIGLLVGLIFACISAIQLAGLAVFLGDLEQQAEGFGFGLGGGFVVFILLGLCFFPIFYGVMGAIAGAIGAILYNLIAGRFGGLIIETRDAKSY